MVGADLDAGSITCAGFPGSLGHEAEDVKMIADFGADYLWLDGNMSAQWIENQRSQSGVQQWTECLTQCLCVLVLPWRLVLLALYTNRM